MVRIKEKLKSGNHSNLLMALLINIFFLALVLIFCDLKYEVSDDFIMAQIMAGEFGNAPNPHMIFVNVIWGYLLLPFYKLSSTVSWYFVSHIVLVFISSVAVTYFLFEKLDKYMAIMLSVIFILFFTSDAYILVQFTKTAMFAVMAGSIIFIDSIFYERNKLKIIGSVCLVLAGTLIRFNTIYVAGGFLIFILGYEFVVLLRKKEERQTKLKKLIQITIAGVLLIGIAFGMRKYDQHVYASDSEYAYFQEYSNARALIVDYTDYGYASYEAELQEMGISETDYKMMKNWLFADDEVFTLEKMQKTGDLIVSKQGEFWKGWNKVIEAIQNRKITNYPVFQVCMVLILLTLLFNYKKWWTVVVANGIGWIYIIYFFVRQRTVYRVEFTIFLGILLCGYYFISKEIETEREKSKIRKQCIIITMLAFVAGCIIYVPERSYIEVSNGNKKSYIEDVFLQSWNYDARKYRKVVNDIDFQNGLLEEMNVNTDKYYFLNFNTTIQTLYYEWKPWQVADWGDNYQYLAGITTNFPDVNANLEQNGLENPLQMLIREDVYLVDNKEIDLTLKYLKEHYYPEARAELYKEIDGYQIWKIYEE